jgi:hypothetical protein
VTNRSGRSQHSPDPPWLFEGARISHSALGRGCVWRIDDHDGRRWVRVRFDPSGAVVAMPLDQLRPHVRLAEAEAEDGDGDEGGPAAAGG